MSWGLARREPLRLSRQQGRELRVFVLESLSVLGGSAMGAERRLYREKTGPAPPKVYIEWNTVPGTMPVHFDGTQLRELYSCALLSSARRKCLLRFPSVLKWPAADRLRAFFSSDSGNARINVALALTLTDAAVEKRYLVSMMRTVGFKSM